MKRVLILTASIILLTTSLSYAEYEGDVCDSFIGQFKNECAPESSTKRRKTAVGGGTEVPLWIHDKFIVEQEVRYDGKNDNLGTYTMVNPQMERGVFQHLGAFIGSGFKKVFGFFKR